METNDKLIQGNQKNQEIKTIPKQKKKGKKKKIIIAIIIILIILGAGTYFIFSQKENQEGPKEIINEYTKYRLSGSAISDFDLFFLQLENEEINKVYSPLSIKYTLAMLQEGANGTTKDQITNIIGNYTPKKYTNSENISIANALFINSNYQDQIKANYINTLKEKYNANVIYDSFQTADNVNKWVKENTFDLIENIALDITEQNFLLINTLGIDMEWVNQIRSDKTSYYVEFPHEDFFESVPMLGLSGYHDLNFNDKENVRSLEISAVANKYDIISEIGEENIRKTVKEAYDQWENGGKEEQCGSQGVLPENEITDIDAYLDEYIEDISKNYKQISSSTDFSFYTNENVKVFAKDLKEYDGTTLEYIGIMPTNENLATYIENMNASTINTLINSLKPIELDSFKEGVITHIHGQIPVFETEYNLNLVNDLNKLGITDAFDSAKADFKNITEEKFPVNEALHKTNIKFSNDGIKAASVTLCGAGGGEPCVFDYIYEVPVEEIDLTFDKPYMYLILDKDTKEVWFAGTVYNPDKYQESDGDFK